MAQPTSLYSPRRSKRKAFTGFGAVLLFVLAFVIFFRMNFRTVVVSGSSMLPTLKNGNKVLVSKAYWLIGQLTDGNIVVIRGDQPGEYIIKRIYRLAGETVDSYNIPDSWSLLNGVYKVPEGNIYVIGDNRGISEDSRRFGPVDLTRVLGKVVAY